MKHSSRLARWGGTLLGMVVVLLLVLVGACVKSNLDNAFDPKNPSGFVFGVNVTGAGSSSSSGSSGSNCVFDSALFDSCTFSN